ncbi:SMP-30/gluconolactonase/LRE family protein [Leptospira bandrabouensis]|uniref:SMP-30/gluconolactonase/LRE family protein n=1 Tax=Leptospira bandrabouensis TaxID=2484903 RepID=UPI001EE88FE4|nr:SMP-30/gluconolactonase/LRE family protein [Leptospira bandrabouensis]MCG6146519.1 SMP-30/gluconolactonase/LRE family protein [Leptospira bandrabouensis]MCG6161891.1 SMP-30/gluconolactonase/LRE family protein [Leptospira bandrabouensis]MCG6166058.1 SMP-30/gluconolactonase/LRE family protein [Leptospira bandrabouensis]
MRLVINTINFSFLLILIISCAPDVNRNSIGDPKSSNFITNLLLSKSSSIQWEVTTFAGMAGVSGFSDGQGSIAKFNSPKGLTIDSEDNLYVADSVNGTIRRITSAGIVSTFAGNASVAGSNVDGVGSSARFNSPSDICIDSQGTLYVADTNNQTIRKINASAEVTTIAGFASSAGFQNGNGTNSRFYLPEGITIDINGNLYVADTANSRIRKIAPNGDVTTLAGSSQGYSEGSGTSALFDRPKSIFFDNSGFLLISDTSNRLIRKLTLDGLSSKLAGRYGSQQFDNEGNASTASISPYGITSIQGVIYFISPSSVVKIENNIISNLVGDGLVLGSRDGIGSFARFNRPRGIVIDSRGNIFVSDTNNHTIRKISRL